MEKINYPCTARCKWLMPDGNCTKVSKCIKYLEYFNQRQEDLRCLWHTGKPRKYQQHQRSKFVYFHPDEVRDLRRKADENRAEG